MSSTVAGTAESARSRHWAIWHSVICLALLAAFVGVGLYIPYRAIGTGADASGARLLAWAVMAGLLVAFLAVLGDGVNGIRRGVLVDSRNRVSLAKIQMAAWTVLILSAYAAAALGNIGTGQADPLNVSIPNELWLAMGISTTSLIGAPLILNPKKRDAKTAERNAEYTASSSSCASRVSIPTPSSGRGLSSPTRIRAIPAGPTSSRARRQATPPCSISRRCRCSSSPRFSSSSTRSGSGTRSRTPAATCGRCRTWTNR